MEGIFEVTYNGQVAGTVEVRKEGLYSRICCRCPVADAQIYRLYAGGEKLGVLIRDRGAMVLETKVPTKRLKHGCVFTLDEPGQNFYPIRPGEEFAHLDKLRRGKMVFRQGELGLHIS